MTKTTTDLYKQTPLGLIPSDWEVRKLEEIFEITAGGDIEKEFVRDEKDHEFQFPVFANAGKNKGLYGYSNKYKVDFECVTLSGRGEIGIANARFEKFYPIVRLLVLKPKQKMDIVFIENYLNKLNIHQESTGVPQLTAPQISKYKILLPPLPEQKAIAQVLSTADAAIQTTEKLITQKEQRKKWLMQQLLAGKKRLLNDELGIMNDEWKPIRIGDVFKFIKSFSISREGLQNDDNGSVFCIHYGDIHAKYNSSFLDFDIQKNIPQLIDESISIEENNFLKDGDIVMADASEDYEGVGAAVEIKNLNGKKAIGGLHT
ncbi:MAG: restriction endonuclease subunit S, partial [Bacteroidota bacterium]